MMHGSNTCGVILISALPKKKRACHFLMRFASIPLPSSSSASALPSACSASLSSVCFSLPLLVLSTRSSVLSPLQVPGSTSAACSQNSFHTVFNKALFSHKTSLLTTGHFYAMEPVCNLLHSSSAAFFSSSNSSTSAGAQHHGQKNKHDTSTAQKQPSFNPHSVSASKSKFRGKPSKMNNWLEEMTSDEILSYATDRNIPRNLLTRVHCLGLYAKLQGSPSDNRLNRLLQSLKFDISKMKTRELVRVLAACWRLAKPDMVPELAQEIVRKSHTLTPQGISNTLSSFANLSRYDANVVNKLLVETKKQATSFNAQDISMTLNALARLGNYDKDVVSMLLVETLAIAKLFTPNGIASVLSAMAKFGHHDRAVVRRLLSETTNKASGFTSQQIATTLGAMGTLGHFDQDATSKLLAETTSKAQQFTPQEISSTLNALAKLDIYDKGLVHTLLSVVVTKIGDLDPQSIASTLRTMSKFGHYDQIVVSKLLEQVCTKATAFNPQNIANTFGALAHFGHYEELAIDALLAEASAKARLFKVEEAASTLAALTNMRQQNGSDSAIVASKLLSEARTKLSNFHADHLTVALSALAKLGCRDTLMVNSILECMLVRAPTFTPAHIAETLTGLAKLDHYDAGVVAKLMSEVKQKAPGFNSRETVKVIHALATLSHYDEAVLKQLLAGITSTQDFGPQEISNTLSTLARFGYYDKHFVSALAAEVEAKMDHFQLRHIVTTLFALSSLAHYDCSVFQKLFSLLPHSCSESPGLKKLLTTSSLLQLRQVQLSMSVEQPAWRFELSPELQSVCEVALSEKQAEFTSSKLHLQVSQTLQAMGIQHRNEVVVGGLLVDIQIDALPASTGTIYQARAPTRGVRGNAPVTAVAAEPTGKHDLKGGLKVVVEVDGLWHFSRGDDTEGRRTNNRRLLGNSLFKRRLLTAQGWCVVSVPYFEWYALQGEYEQQAYYLQRKLSTQMALASK